MKRLLSLMVLLTSYLYAGMYGGILGSYNSMSGTYQETDTNTNVTRKWNVSQSYNTFGLTLGYGFVDSISGEIYLLGGDSFKAGMNVSYAFTEVINDLYPHILIGIGGMDLDNGNFSGESSFFSPDSDPYASSPFIQLGAGLSYVLNNTMEVYGDILVVYYTDDSFSNYAYEYDSYNNITYGGAIDKVTVGFHVGAKFHVFGETTMRREVVIQEHEVQREKEIESFIN